jgi:transcriptional regulator with PAS, ATPase and Fis domain
MTIQTLHLLPAETVNYRPISHSRWVVLRQHLSAMGLKKLQRLLCEFERVANAQARRDRLIRLRQLLKGKLRSLESMQEAFQSIYLPAEQLVEVVEQLERLLGPTHMAPALLLKGSSGTGKTLLARKVAEAAGIHFVKAGVNTLKETNLGESAVAVRELWEAARRSKPCVVFHR